MESSTTDEEIETMMQALGEYMAWEREQELIEKIAV
jgi:hypothetical protein